MNGVPVPAAPYLEMSGVVATRFGSTPSLVGGKGTPKGDPTPFVFGGSWFYDALGAACVIDTCPKNWAVPKVDSKRGNVAKVVCLILWWLQ